MRLLMNKEDICEPTEIPKENWSEFLSTIIKSSIRRDDVIGENLKQQCINYFEQLETNRDEAIKRIKDQMKYLEDVKEFYSDEQDFKDMCFPIINSDWSYYDDMLKILERGKE